VFVSVALHATSVGVQTQRYHASDIAKLALPRYNRGNAAHRRLAKCSKDCHAAAEDGDEEQISRLEQRIDELAAIIWALGDAEIKAVRGRAERILS